MLFPDPRPLLRSTALIAGNILAAASLLFTVAASFIENRKQAYIRALLSLWAFAMDGRNSGLIFWTEGACESWKSEGTALFCWLKELQDTNDDAKKADVEFTRVCLVLVGFEKHFVS